MEFGSSVKISGLIICFAPEEISKRQNAQDEEVGGKEEVDVFLSEKLRQKSIINSSVV